MAPRRALAAGLLSIILVGSMTAGAIPLNGTSDVSSQQVNTTIDWTRAVDGNIQDITTDGQVIYVASGDTVYAFDNETGNKLWQETLPIADFDDIKSLDASDEYLAVEDDNLAYENLYLIDLGTGRYIWDKSFDDSWFGGVVVGDTVITAVDTGFEETTYEARHAQNGSLAWANVFNFDASGFYTFGDENYVSSASQITRYDHPDGLQYNTGEGTDYFPLPSSNQIFAFADSDVPNNEFTPHLIIYERDTGIRKTAVGLDHASYNVVDASFGTNRLFVLLDNVEDDEVVGYNRDTGEKEYALSPNEDITDINARGDYIFAGTNSGDLLVYNQSDESRLAKEVLGSSPVVGVMAAPSRAILATANGNIYSVSVSRTDDEESDGGTTTDPLSLSISTTSATPGENTTISFNVTNQNGTELSGVAIDIESIPNNWSTVDRSDNDGTWQSDGMTWLWLSVPDGESRTPSITLHIPNDSQLKDYPIEANASDSEGHSAQANATISVTEGQSIEQAIAGDDRVISIAEIQEAIQLWQNNEAVPGTNGKTISLQKIQQLIQTWASGGEL